MKPWFLVLLATVLGGCASVDEPLARLRNTDVVEGATVGYGGTEGGFSKSYRQLADRASDEKIRQMTSDRSATIRLMGYIVAIHRWPEQKSDWLARARRDRAEISYRSYCDLLPVTMIVADLVDDEARHQGTEASLLLARGAR